MEQFHQHFAGGQRIGRNEAGHHADDDRANLPVGECRVRLLHLDQPVDDGVGTRRTVRAQDGAVDQEADAGGTVKCQPADLIVAEGIGEDQRRDRYRPIGEGVGLVDVEAEITVAGLHRYAGNQVVHDVDAPTGARDQCLREMPGLGQYAGRVGGRMHRGQHDRPLHVVRRTVHSQGEIVATGELNHLAAEGHVEDIGVPQHLAHIGLAGHYHEAADLQVGRKVRRNHRNASHHPVEKPHSRAPGRAVDAQVVDVEGRVGLGIDRRFESGLDLGVILELEHQAFPDALSR